MSRAGAVLHTACAQGLGKHVDKRRQASAGKAFSWLVKFCPVTCGAAARLLVSAAQPLRSLLPACMAVLLPCPRSPIRPRPRPSCPRDWFHGDGTPAQLPMLSEIAYRLMPALKGAPISSAACVATMTASGYPYIGWTDRSGIAVMTGGNFVSAKSSDELGRLGAKLLVEGSIEADYGDIFTPQFRKS